MRLLCLLKDVSNDIFHNVQLKSYCGKEEALAWNHNITTAFPFTNDRDYATCETCLLKELAGQVDDANGCEESEQ